MNAFPPLHDRESTDPYLVSSEIQGLPLAASLLRMDSNLAHFVIDGSLRLNDSVIACPRENLELGDIHTADAIRNHPSRIMGKIIHIEKGQTYTVRISSRADTKKTLLPVGSASIQVDEAKPFCVGISLTGNPDLKKFIRFHDTIQEQAAQRINVLIDLSGVEKLPSTSSRIFSDLLKSLSKKKRRAAIVNADILGETVRKEHAYNRRILFSANGEDALAYFQNHPIIILVVEDNVTTLETIKSFIKKNKFLPVGVTSGEDALSTIQSQPPDLILMDVNLPGISGIDTIRKIRKFDSCKTIPIILLTSESSRETVQAGLELQVGGYILKPFKSENLIQRILALLTD